MPTKSSSKETKKKSTTSSKKKNDVNETEPQTKKKKVSREDKFLESMAKQFNKAQMSSAVQKKCIQSLQKLQKDDYDKFLDRFFQLIHPVLLVFKREVVVERIVKFVANYCLADTKIKNQDKVLEEEDGEFAVDFIHSIVRYANAKDKAIRFRVAQIVGSILQTLPDEFDPDDNLVVELKKAFLPRLKDKIPLVRQMAIIALEKLQDPSDKDDDISSEFARLMSTDSNKDVRKEAIQRIFLSKTNLVHVIERTRDIKEDVRCAAYEKVFKSINIKKLTILQRVSLIKEGLSDRSKSVKSLVEDLIIKEWLSAFDNDVIKFLQCLDVVEYVEAVENIINIILDCENIQITEPKLDFNQLTPEISLFWRVKIQYLKKKKESMEEYLPPSITDIVHLLIHYIGQRQEFIVSQIIILSRCLDYSDEVGRRNMSVLLGHMLGAFEDPEDFVSDIIKTLRVVLPIHEDFQSTVLNSVDVLRRTATQISSEQLTEEEKKRIANEKEQKISTLSKEKKILTKEIRKLNSDLRKAVDEKDFSKAQALQSKVMEKENLVKQHTEDIERLSASINPNIVEINEEAGFWLRALQVTSHFILESPLTIDISQFIYLFDSLVLQTSKHENSLVRSFSYKLLGQFCALHLETSKTHINKLMELLISEKDHECLNAILESIFDVLFIHPVTKLFSSEDLGTVDVLLLNLRNCLKDNNRTVRTTAVEGFAKLLLTRNVNEVQAGGIISDLILLLFNEATEGDERLRQCLSVFLPAYAFGNISSAKIISSIAIKTLRRVVYSDKDSLLSMVNLQTLVQYLIYLTNAENFPKKVKESTKVDQLLLHEQFAIQLAYEILSDPSSKEAAIYCKQFSNMSIYSTNKTHIKKLVILITRVIATVDNKTTAKSLEKFLAVLKQFLKDDASNNKQTEEEEEEEENVENDTELLQEIETELEEVTIEKDVFRDELEEVVIEKTATPHKKHIKKKPVVGEKGMVPEIQLIEIGEEKTPRLTTKTRTPIKHETLLSDDEMDLSVKTPTPSKNLNDLIRTPSSSSKKSSSTKRVKTMTPTPSKSTPSRRRSAVQYDSEDTDEEDSILGSDEFKSKLKNKKTTFSTPLAQRKSTVQELTDEISELLEGAPSDSE
ncbi:hypothetical protein ABK040_013160 [Willaertia magna]